MSEAPGRHCPLDYGYTPADLAAAAPLDAAHVYVVGGLYGNVEALAAIEALRDEEAGLGRDVTVVFNGDVHWFDIEPEDFEHVAVRTAPHVHCTGNVERELTRVDARAGCGCAYPPFVDDAVVGRSNRIIERLRATARCFPEHLRALAALPSFLRLRMGGQSVGVVHGDAWSLGGWGFSVESLREASNAGWPAGGRSLRAAWAGADVLALCSSHSCLPAAALLDTMRGPRLLMNNGAAGMPNFRGGRAGVLTRISTSTEVPVRSLYGATLGGLRFDALPIEYDHAAWCGRFLRAWPEGSEAHVSYWRRIASGPDHAVDGALFGALAHRLADQATR